MRRKKNLAQRFQNCVDILVENPADHQGKWLAGRCETALHLEIGCGKGRFTMETAINTPEVLHIALEKEQNAMISAMERTLAYGLSNLLFIDTDARHLSELFAPSEITRIYINFPDPWPNNRHAKRRLTSPAFLALYQQVLKPGGEIRFKTDNRDLFAYSVTQFSDHGFLTEDVTTDLHGSGQADVMTDYEQKFHQMGIAICRFVARKKGGDQGWLNSFHGT